ncbi:MAG: response regulator [Lentisphaeraceae bacterium]|nr:response regulator [Lentisphaeraceae bacterium]
MARILVLDDNKVFLTVANDVLTNAGHEVQTVANTSNIEKLLLKERFDLLITDIIMPEREGIEIIMMAKEEYPDMKIIAITGMQMGESFDLLTIAENIGAHGTLKKPFSNSQLLEKVTSIIGQSESNER